MDFTPGTRLGPYEILGSLGAGGMGHVLRARDVKLNRPVAIKVLHGEFAGTPEWLARFEHEARLLATLSHPNIATVHGLDEVDGVRYIAMELVPGQTLAHRLARGPLALNDALSVCKQIAEALETAHDRGIIHRDLKPGNVMLMPDGKVKILDFGLARSTASATGTDAASSVYEAQTEAGLIVGTAAYMAPEQARGAPLDRRCDVWAFGCVLYEVLTGRPAFTGATSTDILAAVIERTPAWDALPANLPPRIAQLLRRCLQKDSQRRLRDVGDARLEIDDALSDSAPTQALLNHRPSRFPSRNQLAWALSLIAVGLVAFAVGSSLSPNPPSTSPVGRTSVPPWSGQFLLGGTTRVYQPRVSPDGNWLAFIVVHEDQAQVGIMRLNSGEWWVLTRNRERGAVNSVCWSIDSTHVVFDRCFDTPVGVYSASILDRSPEGAKEVALLKAVESPQVMSDGSLVVGKLESGGAYRLNRRFPDGSVRAVGPSLEFNRAWTPPLRALHNQTKVVFCGRVLDADASAEHLFYLLDLESGGYRTLAVESVGSAIVPLAVSPQDDFAYSVLPKDDVFQLVRISLTTKGPPEPILTLTAFPWGLDVDAHGRVYSDQIHRSLDALRFALPDPGDTKPVIAERLAVSSLWRQKAGPVEQLVELPDGRVLVPSKVAGHSQLLACLPGKDPTPLLQFTTEETTPPAVLVGQNRLAFMAGPAKNRRLRLATLEDDSISLKPLELGVSGQGVSALSATLDGKRLYYVEARNVCEVPTDASRPPRPVALGDGVAIDPTTGSLLIQRFDHDAVRLFHQAHAKAELKERIIQPGGWRLVPIPICGRAIDARGRVLVTAASRDSWSWRPALLDASGKLQSIPVAYDGDLYPAGWTRDGKVLGMGYSLRSELWMLNVSKDQ